MRKTQEQFITDARGKHGDIYDYSFVNYVNSKNKIDIICKTHGQFSQIATEHLKGRGCPVCGKIRSSRKNNGGHPLINNNEFIQRSINVHGNTYDYSMAMFIGNKKKIQITCKKHGDFWKTPENHIFNEQGCPRCSTTKGELKISVFLYKNFIPYVSQKTFYNCKSPKGYFLKFDFYIPSKNLLIEYDGEQHYGCNRFKHFIISQDRLDRLRINDEIKNKYALDNNIKLLRIKYTEINNIDNILQEELYG
jgi:hypothetical protein